MKQLTQERKEVLLKEYDEQRGLLKDMVQDLEKIKVKIETLLPERLDARLVRFFEEKVKSISMLFQIILDIRKEILKSVRDEIEMRKKVDIDKELEDSIGNIRELAHKVEKYQKDHKELLGEQTKEEEPKGLPARGPAGLPRR